MPLGVDVLIAQLANHPSLAIYRTRLLNEIMSCLTESFPDFIYVIQSCLALQCLVSLCSVMPCHALLCLASSHLIVPSVSLACLILSCPILSPRYFMTAIHRIWIQSPSPSKSWSGPTLMSIETALHMQECSNFCSLFCGEQSVEG